MGMATPNEKRRTSTVNANASIDRLTSLPDDLLHRILSFLPIRQAISTTPLLCHRFRGLWSTSPDLHFRDSDISFGKISRLVDRALLVRNSAPIRSFRLSSAAGVSSSDLHTWIPSISHGGLQTLHLNILYTQTLTLPNSIFTLKSLRTIDLNIRPLQSFRWPPSAYLPSLKNLRLEGFIITNEIMAMANNLPRLKKLSMQCCLGPVRFVVECPALENLDLQSCKGMKELAVAGESLRRLHVKSCFSCYGREASLRVTAPMLDNFAWCDHAPFKVSIDSQRLSSASVDIDSDVCLFRGHDGVVDLVVALLGAKRLVLNDVCLSVLGSAILNGDTKRRVNLLSCNLTHLVITARLDPMYFPSLCFLLESATNLEQLTVVNEAFNVMEESYLSHFNEKGGIGRGGYWESQEGLSLAKLGMVKISGLRGTIYEADFISFLLEKGIALAREVREGGRWRI